ncbi:DNA-binding protein [Streptomyces asiaticus]
MNETPKTLLKLLVTQQRMTYATFERLFNNAADRVVKKGTKNPTCGETQFRRWTGGKLKSLPGADTCLVLEAMFPGYDVEALFGPPPATSPQVPAFDLEEQILMTAHEAHEDADSTATASISNTTIDQLRDRIGTLAQEYHARPALTVFSQAEELRQDAERHRDRTQIPVQQQELLILCGQAVALLSAAAFNLGSLSGARRLARTAALYGESARFTPLQAFADGSLAYIAYHAGEPTEAIVKARSALSHGGLGDVAKRRLLAIQARALGHLGDVESAQRAIRQSEETGLGHRDDLHDGVGGEFGFPDERLAMSNSSTALLIGNGAQAEATARRALALLSVKNPTSRAAHVLGSAAADLALARLISGDVDGAAEALEPIWAIPGDHRITGILVRAAQVRRYLSQPVFHGARLPTQLRERIEDFTRASAPYQLGNHQLAVEA